MQLPRLLFAATTVPVAVVGRMICADIVCFLDHGFIRLRGAQAKPAPALQLAGGAATGAAIAVCPAGYLPAVTLFAGTATLIATVDFTTGIIPNRLVYPGTIAGLVLAAYGYGRVDAREAIVGVVLAWCVPAFSAALALLASRRLAANGLARGDWKLAAMIGAWLGTVPTLAALACALFAHLLVVTWRGRTRPMPFAPAFCLFALFFLVFDLFGAPV